MMNECYRFLKKKVVHLPCYLANTFYDEAIRKPLQCRSEGKDICILNLKAITVVLSPHLSLTFLDYLSNQ